MNSRDRRTSRKTIELRASDSAGQKRRRLTEAVGYEAAAGRPKEGGPRRRGSAGAHRPESELSGWPVPGAERVRDLDAPFDWRIDSASCPQRLTCPVGLARRTEEETPQGGGQSKA